jgi:hypothetical protein
MTTRCGHEVALLDSGGTLVIDGKVTVQEVGRNTDALCPLRRIAAAW